MKIISIILTALLLIPVIDCSITVYHVYFRTSISSAVPGGLSFSIAKPVIIYGISYLVFFVLSLLLNVKGKFAANIVLAFCLMLIYIFTIHTVKGTWLG